MSEEVKTSPDVSVSAENANTETVIPQGETKFCTHCGQKVMKAAVVCPHCGCQLEQLTTPAQQQPTIVINNSNSNSNTNVNTNSFVSNVKTKNKWVAFLLCFFLGYLGAHKFYEGKVLLGIVYIFTMGLFGIGILVDLIRLLFKPLNYTV